jgi:hypothetical protein
VIGRVLDRAAASNGVLFGLYIVALACAAFYLRQIGVL